MTILECILAIATAGAAIGLVFVTVSLVRKTDQLVRETRRQRSENKMPLVSLELLPGKHSREFFDLVLANAGRGAAFNIEFEIHSDEEDFSRCKVLSLRGPSKVINFLLPGSSLRFPFGVFSDLTQINSDGTILGEPLKEFMVTVEYENCDGKKFSGSHQIDIRTYKGLNFLKQSTAKKQQRNVEKISGTMESIKGTLKKLERKL